MYSSRFLRGIIAVNRGSQPHQEEADMDATTVAVDLAKDVFEVALADRAHRNNHRAGTAVVMEACGTAHYWGRRCQARGLTVRLIPVQYVRPYVRRNKTDRTDTE